MHEAFHEPGHAGRQLAAPRGGSGVSQHLVFVDKTANDRVVAQPAAGLGLPGFERFQAAFANHPGLVNPRGVVAQDQVGQGAAAQVGGADALPAIPPGQRNAGLVIAKHVRAELARHAEVAAQEWVIRTFLSWGKSSPNR